MDAFTRQNVSAVFKLKFDIHNVDTYVVHLILLIRLSIYNFYEGHVICSNKIINLNEPRIYLRFKYQL